MTSVFGAVPDSRAIDKPGPERIPVWLGRP